MPSHPGRAARSNPKRTQVGHLSLSRGDPCGARRPRGQHRNQGPGEVDRVVVYCQSGSRSAVAADVLTKMGYTNVSSLADGFAGYLATGLSVGKLSMSH